MSWKARSTSVISSRPARGGLSGLPSANRRALSRRTVEALDDPLEEQEGEDQRRDHDRRAPADERPDLPRRGRAEALHPLAVQPLLLAADRVDGRRGSPRGAASPGRARTIARSRSPARTSRSSSATQPQEGVGPGGELGDPGPLPRVVRDQLPQLPELRGHLAAGRPRIARRSDRGDGEDQAADPRVRSRRGRGGAPRPWR